MLNLEQLQFKISCLTICSYNKILLDGLIHKKLDNLNLTSPVEITAIDTVKFIKYLSLYDSLISDRINKSDEFVKLLFEVSLNPIQKYERKQKNQSKGVCAICKKNDSCDLHHIIPLVYGGNNENYNFTAICNYCHQSDAFEYFLPSLQKLIEDMKSEYS